MRSQTFLMFALGTGFGAGAAAGAVSVLGIQAQADTRTPEPSTFQPERSFAPLVEALSPAVVNIEVSQAVTVDPRLEELRRQLPPGFSLPEGLLPEEGSLRQGQGSGVLISADGYLITNNHVIDGAETVTVRLQDDRTFSGEVVGVDDSLDVALVKISASAPLPFAELGDSEQTAVGDWVVAIGNPFGLSHTVTAGIVSAKGRVIGAGPYDEFIQTDAAINPGNSGGPLFNLDGEVVGINTAINPMAQGVGFSVPIDAIAPILDDLKAHGHVARGWLGVGLETDADAPGARVRAVYPDTPAAAAGLLAGDQILSIDGTPVTGSDELVRRVGQHRAGEQLKLEILRDSRKKDLQVTLGERPAERDLRAGTIAPPTPEVAPKTAPSDSPPRLGVHLQSPAEVGLEDTTGAVITRVERGSRADGRLQPGDVVISADGRPITSPQDLQAALKDAGRTLRLGVLRGDHQELVVIPLR